MREYLQCDGSAVQPRQCSGRALPPRREVTLFAKTGGETRLGACGSQCVRPFLAQGTRA